MSRSLCRWPPALALLVTLLVPSTALAWDPDAFVSHFEAADAAFVSERYDDALTSFQSASAMLSAALSLGEIDAADEATARESLAVIEFQIARSKQMLDRCEDAHVEFQGLVASSHLTPKLKALLAVRLLETKICIARRADGDPFAALDQLDGAQDLKEAADRRFESLTLEPNERDEVDVELARVITKLELAVDQSWSGALESVRALVSAGECTPAAVELASLRSRGSETHGEELEALVAVVDSTCNEDERIDEPTVTRSWYEPVGATVLMGTGGALLLADLIYELTLMSDVDELASLRTQCADIGVGCLDAQALEADFETARIVSGSLIGVGAAALVGGLIWYLVYEPEATAPVVDVDLGRDAIAIIVEWRL